MPPIGNDHKREIQLETDVLSHTNSCINSALVNAILFAYQKVLHKVLGTSAIAYTQILISELGDLLANLIGPELTKEFEGALDEHNGTTGTYIAKIFKKLGIAKDAKVKTENDREIIIEVIESVFNPTYELLAKEGIEVTLAPEAFLIASLIRTWLRKRGTGNERVHIYSKAIKGGLEIRVTRIGNLK